MSATLVGVLSGIGAAHLVAYYAEHRAVAGVLKAVPILMLAAIVFTTPGPAGAAYAGVIALGLVLSAVGDVSLVFRNGFLWGLSAFFAAHVCYVTALAPGAAPTPAAIVAAVAIIAFAGAMLRYLWPHLGPKLRIPVVVYVAALGLMAWCAIARASVPGSGDAARAGALGAVSFLVSDGVLAVDRFARRFAGAHAVVMVTYYAAQMAIARSAL